MDWMEHGNVARGSRDATQTTLDWWERDTAKNQLRVLSCTGTGLAHLCYNMKCNG